MTKPRTIYDLPEVYEVYPDRISTHRKLAGPPTPEIVAVIEQHGPAAGLAAYVFALADSVGSFDVRSVDEHYASLAAVLLDYGLIWDSTTHPERPMPRGYPRPKLIPGEEGGCGRRAETITAEDSRLTHYVGWMLFRDDDSHYPGETPWRIWAHEWAATPSGLYIDTGCGLSPDQAVYGVPRQVEIDLVETNAFWGRMAQ